MDAELIRILLIEDNPGDARLLQELLVEADSRRFQLIHVDRLSAGLERLARGGIDVVLLDLSLPDSYGADTLTRLQSGTPGVPIVVLTSLDDEVLGMALVQAGAQDYLIKGQVTGPLLLRSVRYAIERQRTEVELQARASQQVAVAQLGQRALANPDLNALLDEAVSLVAETLGVEYSQVLELLPDREALRLRAGVGWPSGLVGQVTVEAKLDSQMGYTLLSSEPVIVEDFRTETRFSGPRLPHEHGVISGMSVVIEGRKWPFGVLGVHTTQRRTFTQDDIYFLQAIANVLAAAIERNWVEETLRESEEKYRTLIEQSNDAIYLIYGHKFEVVNRKFEELFGVTQETINAPGFGFTNIVAPKSRAMVLERTRREDRGEKLSPRYEFTALDKEGREIEVEVSASYPVYRGGLATQGVLRDITERKRAEQALRESEERFRLLVEGVKDYAIFLLDPGGHVVSWNAGAERIKGYQAEEIIGQHFSCFYSDEDIQRGQPEQDLQVAVAEGHCENEGWQIRQDGSRFWANTLITPLRDEAGQLRGFSKVTRDVTERRQLEEQLHQSQKLEAVGRLAGGIAHDFNNLMLVITGYSELLLHRHLNPSDPLRGHVEQIYKAGDRAAALTRQLLAFSRKQVLEPKVLDLNEVMAEMDKLLRRLIGEDIDLMAISTEGLGRVKADPGQLEQVIMNLVVNARDAMPQGGKLTIETANVELDQAYVRQHAEISPGPYVLLAVSDTGIGIDEETLSHIFEPFFTTKEQGKGTGLGLATVYGIVKQSGGHISVYSEVGRGTTFKVYLPRIGETVETLEAGPTPIDLPPGSETILLVEDADSVRELVRSLLQEDGYTILEASNGDEALQVCAQHSGPIQLLMTDVIMPGGMNGRELAERLTFLRPGLKVLYISGYTNEAIIHRGVLDHSAAFLQKPFTPDALACKVREVLNAPPVNNG